MNSANSDLKILCVDDDVDVLEMIADVVKAAGFTPVLCDGPEKAIVAFKAEAQSLVLVLSDFKMPGMSGFQLREELMKHAAVPFIIISAFVTKETALAALHLKIAAFIDKPVSPSELAAAIRRESKERVESIREGQALERTFLDESLGILEELEPILLAMDKDRANPDSLNVIFRGAHTIKGSSGILSTDFVTRYVHRYEDIISGVKKGTLEFTDEVYEVLLKGLDRIKELIGTIQSKAPITHDLDVLLAELSLGGGAKPAPSRAGGEPATAKQPQAQGKSSAGQKPKDTIPVPLAMLDELSSFSGEITVIRNMVNKIVRSLERQHAGNKEIQSLGELLEEMHKINGTIQTRITDLRKVPLSAVVRPLPRIVRDLSRDLAKPMKLEIRGDALRVDNSLAAVCTNSLVHLVRNSADHGIEPPRDRETAGKDAASVIEIECCERDDEVVIAVRDDGRGIDPNVIKRKALERNLFTEAQLAEMSPQDVLGIIFASGFSTAAKVTDVSGRGVGMDMVKSSVEAVGGRIHIESTPGHGTTFELRLPVPKSVLIINSLIVVAGGQTFAVPQDTIVRVLRIKADERAAMIQDAASGRVLRTDDQIFPYIDLADVLQTSNGGGEPTGGDCEVTEVLLLKSETLSYALRVDAIMDSEEIVVKRTSDYINPRGAFGGATFMGDGSVGLILDVKGLGQIADLKAVRGRADAARAVIAESSIVPSDLQTFLLFKLDANGIYGVALDQVFRLEEIEAVRVQRSGGGDRVVVYRDQVMPLISVRKVLKLSPAAGAEVRRAAGRERISTIVARTHNRFLGLEVAAVIDIASAEQGISNSVRDRMGIAGNAFIRDRNVTIIDLAELIRLSASESAETRAHA